MERLAFLKQLAMKYGNVPEDFSSDTTFLSMNMDSYDIVDFMLAVEEAYGITADDEVLLKVKCIRDVEDLITECMKEDNSKHA